MTAVLEAPAEWGVGEVVPASTFASLSEDAMLTELAKHERWTAWLAARGVALTEALTRSRERGALERLEHEQPDPSARTRNLARTEARACIEDEVALATGLPAGVCRARTKLAIGDPVRHGPVRRALAEGELSWHRAWHVLRSTEEAPATALAGIVDRLVAPHPLRGPHGKGGLLVPQPVFTSRLRYQLAKVTTPAERHENAMGNRRTLALIHPEDGTGQFSVTGHAARIVGAHERIDRIARRLRATGDARTLAHLRSDITLDLILYGQLPSRTGLFDPCTGRATHDDEGTAVEQDPAYSLFAGQLPPARVDVVVPLSTLLGAADQPGMIACGGEQDWLAARFVRDIACTAGSTWRRLVTDPLTGHMLDLHVRGYQITGDLRERVLARDRVSRAPGSTRPARACDTDHDLDYASSGPSSESNVSAKHRRGHNHKTRRTWHSRRDAGINGGISWTTPTGRVYTTTPWDYRDPDPPTLDQMRATFEHTVGEWRRAEGGVAPPPDTDLEGADGARHSRHTDAPPDHDEEEWMRQDLDLDLALDLEPGDDVGARAASPRVSPPSVRATPPPSEFERRLTSLIDDAHEPSPLHVRRRKPRAAPKAEPPPWERRDAGPPPF
ncbi:hypothetical protein [Mobilicoccus massiliensis]|uniref:hypothetical protein n=1 Tax=Mobilicoccus massiliensis TaxID=1522310 RepID=UPI00058F0949|nr:hypothetical protein [Mobilicoccus massiliensis]